MLLKCPPKEKSTYSPLAELHSHNSGDGVTIKKTLTMFHFAENFC